MTERPRRARTGERRWFRDLPLFWKLLIPYFALMVVVGLAGAFRVVDELSSRAETSLDQQLLQQSLSVRTLLRDRELYLLESVNFATNLQGMAAALEARDRPVVARLLGSVRRLKRDLDVAAILDARARPFEVAGSPMPRARRSEGFVARALSDRAGGRYAGVLGTGEERMLAIAAAVCATSNPCAPAGVAVAGMDFDGLLNESLQRAAATGGESDAVALYASSGELLGAAGRWRPPEAVPTIRGGAAQRRTIRTGDGDFAILYAPYEVQGRHLGTFAVQQPTAPAFVAARRAAIQLGILLLIGMAGVVAIGAFLSRMVVSQVRPVLATVRRLEEGELTARATTAGADEVGRLAAGINAMAQRLQESHATLDARVRDRTEEVQRLLEQRSELFASISHELRTPLAIILNQAGLIAKAAPADATIAKAGDRIDGSARELLALVNEILDFAKAEGGMLTIEPVPVSVRATLDEIVPSLEPLFGTGGPALRVDVPADLPDVMADPKRLRTILQNLLDNAVKYTPSDGRVVVTASAGTDGIEIVVADTGVGIPPDARELIFEPFYRAQGTAPLRGAPSTGLGLALTRRLVHAQGGTIVCRGGEDGGASFHVVLPRA